MQVARIKLSGKNPEELDAISSEIREVAKKFGVSFRGPIPLPTKKLKLTVLKTPCGDSTGHGNATYDKWEMRIHKRLIDIIEPTNKTIDSLTHLQLPAGVDIELKM